MRLSDLRDKPIRTTDGRALGRVHDVHCERGRIVALMCGSGSLVERWTGRKGGHKIPWERVTKVDRDQITIAPDGPPKKTNATRTRQGTRRTSARRSKR